ncbi:hypothetical protein [Aeromicrobium sp. 179-A 4D2 NHS]|uniref:hypothetical protein n=1 Tax=Aeromicrobium sp. 179-A 4D2 NHS TaxID=3142375 RepID=UPI0039A145EA
MSTDQDTIVTNYKVHPTGWFDACRELGPLQDSFSVSVTRGFGGRWLITRGVTHWSPTYNEWRDTHNGYTGKPPRAEDYMDLDTALKVARELANKATNVRGRTFMEALKHERALKAETEAKTKARRDARMKVGAKARR